MKLFPIDKIRAAFSQQGLRGQVLRGGAWTTFGFGANTVIRIGSTLALTRLLTPDVFGLMSLAGVFLIAINMFSELGTVPSIIRSTRGDDPEFLRTAWTIQVIRGGCICAVVCLLAWPVSQIYDQPVLFPLMCALSLNAVMEGFTSISIATCRRHMQLSRLTMLNVAVQLGVTAANILAAWYFRSVWALVVGSLCGSVLRVTLSYYLLPAFKHGFRMERETLREIVTFGRWLLLATMLTFIGGKGSRAIMGGLVDITTLGFITLASTLAWALGDLCQKILSNTAFPSLSRIYRERPGDLPDAMTRIKRVIILGTLPLFLALSFLAQPLIDLLYDPRYAIVGSYVSLLALNGAIGILTMPYQNLVLARGDGRFHAFVMFCRMSLRLGGLVSGFLLFGVYGMIAGMGVSGLILFAISAGWAYRNGVARLDYDIAALAVILPIYVAMLSRVTTGG